MFDAISKNREVLFLQPGNNLSALLVVNHRVHIDDLSGDGDLLSLLRFTGQVGGKRLFLLARLSCFTWSLVFLLIVVGGWRRDCPRAQVSVRPVSKPETTIKAKNDRANLESFITSPDPS